MIKRFNPRTRKRQISVKKIREPGAVQSFTHLDNWETLQNALPSSVYVCVCVFAHAQLYVFRRNKKHGPILFLHYFL